MPQINDWVKSINFPNYSHFKNRFMLKKKLRKLIEEKSLGDSANNFEILREDEAMHLTGGMDCGMLLACAVNVGFCPVLIECGTYEAP